MRSYSMVDSRSLHDEWGVFVQYVVATSSM